MASETDVIEEEEELSDEMVSQILNCPDILAALQGRLRAEMMAALPGSVKRRVKALKKLQFESIDIEAKFCEEVYALECKYHKLCTPLYEKRSKIIVGKYEPNDKECDWQSEDEDLKEDKNNEVKIEDDVKVENKENEIQMEVVKGIPNFWLTIFKNVGILSAMIQEHDEPILEHLIDIQVIFLESNTMGFILKFYFSNNEYFSNSALMKEYEMKCAPEEDDPFSFEGPEIFKSHGCTINWKKNKNVTLKTVNKKQKRNSSGTVSMITKTVQNASFFNFFSPPEITDNAEEISQETRALLTSDFEIGHYIRERVVPHAVLYFTGEGLEDEDYEETEEENEEENEDEEDTKADGKD